ncbi:MAG: zinc ribbon domain-containing protein [Spirochaetes bacterium]|nr:zinc ribbon domain-containing protein [Spirochaetota bacterium]
MPVYEYICRSCSHKFETLVRNADNRVLCPQCNSPELSKCFSTFAHRGKEAGADADSSPSSGSKSCSGCHSRNCASCR